ncbi:MAG: hypothetical protein K6E19_02640 [Lachnospiraceae bacterium]|nr:hypothetical protein [Lachnospiraceae bacterium]
MISLDLSGDWLCVSPLDLTLNKKVKLPGSSCKNGIGTPVKFYDEYCKEAVRAPRERFEYIGPLDYFKTVDIPEDFEGCEVVLFLERVNISSRLWFDNIEIGRGIIGLSTPHVYRLSDRVDSEGNPLIPRISGKHMLRLQIDNSNLLNMGDMASGYSVDTGGYWNGVVGRMELRCKSACSIENVSVFPEGHSLRIDTVTVSDRHVPMDIRKAAIKYEITTPDGQILAPWSQDIELFSKRQRNHYTLTLPENGFSLWSEFNTGLYSVKVTLKTDSSLDSFETTFGIRKIEVRNKEFKINGRTLSLRGTINCAQYPITGYPPMDEETWTEHFTKLKEFGLNHVRFHAWCPPEAAFAAADKLGLYLGIEMPLWLNRDVTPVELGDDDWHRLYYREEALRISETYGNHPSFVMFSNGNENLGDYALLETITEEMKAHDNRRIYTMSSNFDHPLSPAEDYLCAFEILHNKARIQFLHDEVAKSTTVNYDEMRAKVPVPFTSFEVGQYCVYPDVDICEDYTGAMAPVNFDIIRKEMKRHGVYDRLRDYVAASGDLAAKLYKEDIEAVLRTRGMGGFQLLSLTDYTGQSTATIGMLDVLFREKKVVSPETWRGFCSEVVPLLWAKREFLNTESLTGFISLYDQGAKEISNPVYELKITDKTGEEILFETKIPRAEEKTEIDIPLDFVKENALLKVYITVRNGEKTYTNSWRIFVYKDSVSRSEGAVIPAELIVNSGETYEKAVRAGGKYLITPDYFGRDNLVKSSFIPVFWSPVHFPSEAPVGFMIDEDSPVLKSFPTEKYGDYQWKEPVDHSLSVRLHNIPGSLMSAGSKSESGALVLHPVLEFVPNFADNEPKSPLFTFKAGNAEFLYCGFDLERTDLATKALRCSIVDYLV